MENIVLKEIETVLSRFLDRTSNKEIVSPRPLDMLATAFCLACQAAFTNAADMQQHVETACRSSLGHQLADHRKPFKCTLCNAAFAKTELSKHLVHFDVR